MSGLSGLMVLVLASDALLFCGVRQLRLENKPKNAKE
jgi:hypothetical protein